MRAVDLCCGRGGVTRALLALGYDVIGVDIEHHPDYPIEATFLQADIRTLDGTQFRGCLFMWASPPCQAFSRHDQPWTRARNPPPTDLTLVRACYRIRDEAQPGTFILENVRGAQKFIGKAILQRAGRYLWGDVILAPTITAKQKQSYSSKQADLRSEVPFDLVYCLAGMAAGGYRHAD